MTNFNRIFIDAFKQFEMRKFDVIFFGDIKCRSGVKRETSRWCCDQECGKIIFGLSSAHFSLEVISDEKYDL